MGRVVLLKVAEEAGEKGARQVFTHLFRKALTSKIFDAERETM
jgi:hypothetical protein